MIVLNVIVIVIVVIVLVIVTVIVIVTAALMGSLRVPCFLVDRGAFRVIHPVDLLLSSQQLLELQPMELRLRKAQIEVPR